MDPACNGRVRDEGIDSPNPRLGTFPTKESSTRQILGTFPTKVKFGAYRRVFGRDFSKIKLGAYYREFDAEWLNQMIDDSLFRPGLKRSYSAPPIMCD